MKTLSENINSEPDTKSSESYSTVTKDNAKVETGTKLIFFVVLYILLQ